ncbi:hypothetical protein BDB01DRAFT_893300 [Pilobolus umbonatus]|nr:hypothetical protein BDB01DRAFT_893300 [Pilobolus umbonatus]
MFRQCIKKYYSTKIPVDEYCLPLKPTWSVKSLLEPVGQPISDKQFQHLLKLSQLSISKERVGELKAEIDQLTQFTDHVRQYDFKGVTPLTHIWKEETSQILRDDTKVEASDEARSRVLLKHASKTSGNFYVVKGSMPSSE